MRLLISILILVLSVTLSARGQAVRNLNGSATNLTLRGVLTNGTTVMTGGWIITNINTGVVGTFSAPGISLSSGGNNAFNAAAASGNVDFAGVVSGNGAGLTNLASNTNITQNITYNGKITFTSNVTFRVVDFITNSHPSTTVISLTNSYGAFATNNNIAFSGLAGKSDGATNVQTVSIFITNSSAAVKTIAMDAQFQNMDALEGNTLYFTNVGHLLVFHYPGLGTNFYFKSR